MSLLVEKNEQYALLSVKQASLDADMAAQIEKNVAGMYSGESRTNFIINLDDVAEIAEKGHQLFSKIQKLCEKESGLLVLVSRKPDLMDDILGQTEESLLVLPTNEEAVDAIFMNELENDFKDGEENEFGFDEESDY